MAMSRPIKFWHQSVTRLRPGETESRGSIIPDWDNPDRLKIDNCSVQPSETGLSQDGRVLGLREDLRVFMPLDADVKEGDHIIYDGEEYSISGMPQKRISATGRLDHIQLNLERWSG
ncbi:MAG: hypothetical protein K5886_02800 [Lachnospiraceae bacterium]|nr:hypothetical protein [Lachnospiraceae bacterium]